MSNPPSLQCVCLQTHKDLPAQFLRSSSPLSASIVIASFGSSAGYNSEAFPLTIELDPNIPIPVAEKPVRYGKLPEIHHIFRSDPKSPNITISSFFLLAVVATFSPLFGAVSTGKPWASCILLTIVVGISRRQHQSHFKSHVRRSSLARAVRRLYYWHRRRFLPLLYCVEPFSNITCPGCSWGGGIFVREQSAYRGARTSFGRSALRLQKETQLWVPSCTTTSCREGVLASKV